MTLFATYEAGRRAAYTRFKLSMVQPPVPETINPAQATAAAMPAVQAKPATPPTAPIAAHASKANILG